MLSVSPNIRISVFLLLVNGPWWFCMRTNACMHACNSVLTSTAFFLSPSQYQPTCWMPLSSAPCSRACCKLCVWCGTHRESCLECAEHRTWQGESRFILATITVKNFIFHSLSHLFQQQHWPCSPGGEVVSSSAHFNTSAHHSYLVDFNLSMGYSMQNCAVVFDSDLDTSVACPTFIQFFTVIGP